MEEEFLPKKICKEQYQEDYDSLIPYDRPNVLTDIDCYVSNLEKKIDTLDKGIDELIKKYDYQYEITTYPTFKTMSDDLKNLKGSE